MGFADLLSAGGRDFQSDLPFLELCHTFWAWAVHLLVAYVRHFYTGLWCRFGLGTQIGQDRKPGYAPLWKDFEYFYTKWIYGQVRDCWERPICSAPGPWVDVMERDISIVNHVATYHYTGRSIPCLNLSSYNYLGFSQKDSPYTQALIATLQARGCSTTSTRLDYGTVDLHRQLEGRVASFVGTEDAMILPMGYATNSTVLPALVGPGCLIISDSYNHASLVVGSRVSGAKITIFQHNNPASLEKKLREAVTAGQPRTRRPWVKILIVVEGIYSMEGEILRLREIVDIKKRYKAYLYVDEAHSIGALGTNGRGVCEHAGVDPADVDVLMGTFTKSFASVGGYIAGSKQLVSHLRRSSHSHLYDCSMSSAAACQVLCALDVLEGASGKRRVEVLRQNALLFRSGLRAAGFTVLGDDASPVVPVLFGSPCKYTVFSRQCLARGIAVVIVGFPATPVLYGRVRFCVSAGHTPEDLQKAIQVISEVGDIAMMRYNRHKKITSSSS